MRWKLIQDCTLYKDLGQLKKFIFLHSGALKTEKSQKTKQNKKQKKKKKRVHER